MTVFQSVDSSAREVPCGSPAASLGRLPSRLLHVIHSLYANIGGYGISPLAIMALSESSVPDTSGTPSGRILSSDISFLYFTREGLRRAGRPALVRGAPLQHCSFPEQPPTVRARPIGVGRNLTWTMVLPENLVWMRERMTTTSDR